MPESSTSPAGAETDPKVKRRAQVAAGVARHKEKMDSLSRLEQAAWKGRKVLGEAFDPYTPEERESLAKVRRLETALAEAASSLNASLIQRLRREIADHPERAVLLATLEAGAASQISLPPH